jgi:hypothetical protein
VVGEKRNSQILVNLPATHVPRCTSSNAKKLGLKHLKLSDVASRSGPPDGARIIHHWTDELPEQQNTVPNGEATPPVLERAQNTQPLRGFLPYLADVSRPGQPFIKSNPQIAGCINPHDWLTEERGLDTPACEEHGGQNCRRAPFYRQTRRFCLGKITRPVIGENILPHDWLMPPEASLGRLRRSESTCGMITTVVWVQVQYVDGARQYGARLKFNPSCVPAPQFLLMSA